MRNTLPLLFCLALLSGCTSLVKGSIALSVRDYDTAIGHYAQAVKDDPESLYARNRLGLAYFSKGDYAKAIEVFEAVLAKKPNETFATFHLGMSLIGKGDREAGFKRLAKYSKDFGAVQERYVRQEAARLAGHPDLSAQEIFTALKEAEELGIIEQYHADQPDPGNRD